LQLILFRSLRSTEHARTFARRNDFEWGRLGNRILALPGGDRMDGVTRHEWQKPIDVFLEEEPLDKKRQHGDPNKVEVKPLSMAKEVGIESTHLWFYGLLSGSSHCATLPGAVIQRRPWGLTPSSEARDSLGQFVLHTLRNCRDALQHWVAHREIPAVALWDWMLVEDSPGGMTRPKWVRRDQPPRL